MFGATSFWVRAEPLLLFCSSLAVLSLTVPATPATVLLGIAVGAGVESESQRHRLPVSGNGARMEEAWSRQVRSGSGDCRVGRCPAVPRLSELSRWRDICPGYAPPPVKACGCRPCRPRSSGRSSDAPMLLSGRAEHCAPRRAGRRRRLPLAGSSRRCSFRFPIAAKHGTGLYHFLPFVPLNHLRLLHRRREQGHGSPRQRCSRHASSLPPCNCGPG